MGEMGSGPFLAISNAFSHPLLQPPGFHRAYSSPLYSDQQYACVKDLCKCPTWDLRERASLEMVSAPPLDLETKF